MWRLISSKYHYGRSCVAGHSVLLGFFFYCSNASSVTERNSTKLCHMFGRGPDMKTVVQKLESTYNVGPKTVYFLVVSWRHHDLSANVFGRKYVIEKGKRVLTTNHPLQFIYPALLTPSQSLVFSDQFAFRPSGSPTAVIAILQAVTNLLSDHPYVIVISLDFSKAFDTVRHTTLLQKFAQLDIPDAVYN